MGAHAGVAASANQHQIDAPSTAEAITGLLVGLSTKDARQDSAPQPIRICSAQTERGREHASLVPPARMHLVEYITIELAQIDDREVALGQASHSATDIRAQAGKTTGVIKLPCQP